MRHPKIASLTISAALVCAISVLSGCSKPDPIVGKWQTFHQASTYIFEADHSFTYSNSSFDASGTWSMIANKLTLNIQSAGGGSPDDFFRAQLLAFAAKDAPPLTKEEMDNQIDGLKKPSYSLNPNGDLLTPSGKAGTMRNILTKRNSD